MNRELNDDTPIYHKVANPQAQPEKKWYEKILTPTFRRWAYGVAAAGLTAGFTIAGRPEFIPLIAPLVMAIFYVDENGEPR